MRPYSWRTRVAVLATLAISAGATLAIWKHSPWRLSSWLARQIRTQWESGSGVTLELHAERLVALDGAGWKVLVSGLHSKRIEVRQNAERTIEAMVRSWRSLPPEMSAPKATLLARLLAENLVRTDADAVGRAARLAERLLDWPSVDQNGLNRIYYCEQVLRAAREQGWPQPDTAEPSAEPQVMTAVVEEPPASRPAVAHLSDMRPLEEPTQEESWERSRGAQFASAQTAPAEPDAAGNPLRDPVGSRSAPRIVTPELEEDRELGPAQGLDPDWPRLDLLELIRHLRPGVPVEGATAELRRRGMDERNLGVARAAAHPDPELRVQLVRTLVGLQGIDSTGWLLLLARDESPSVRAAAVQLLSTATDPRIRRHLAELEETETDSRVRTALQNGRQALR